MPKVCGIKAVPRHFGRSEFPISEQVSPKYLALQRLMQVMESPVRAPAQRETETCSMVVAAWFPDDLFFLLLTTSAWVGSH